MAWQIQPFSRRCFVSDAAFETGDAYESFLLIDEANELQRFDVAEEKEERFELEGELLWRWRQEYKEPPEKDDSTRRQRESAEEFFLSLFEDSAESEEDAIDPEEVE